MNFTCSNKVKTCQDDFIFFMNIMVFLQVFCFYVILIFWNNFQWERMNEFQKSVICLLKLTPYWKAAMVANSFFSY